MGMTAAETGAGGNGAGGHEPVPGLAFKVQILGKTVGRFSEVSGLQVEYEVLEYQEGGQNAFVHRLRGRAKYPNLVLKRGITDEAVLLDWFFACRDRAERHDVVVTLQGPATRRIRSWSFKGAFPVKWTGPTLNAGQNAIATETLEIAHQGLTPQ